MGGGPGRFPQDFDYTTLLPPSIFHFHPANLNFQELFMKDIKVAKLQSQNLSRTSLSSKREYATSEKKPDDGTFTKMMLRHGKKEKPQYYKSPSYTKTVKTSKIYHIPYEP